MTSRRVCSLSALWNGEMQACVVDGCKVVLLRTDDNVYAYEDRCAHLGVRLSEGTLRDGRIVCAAHGYEYDAVTGAGVNPRTVCLKAFPVRIDDDEIYVDISPMTRP